MPGQHKYSPIRIRLPEADRIWVLDRAAQTGDAVNAIVAKAVAAYRETIENTAPRGTGQ